MIILGTFFANVVLTGYIITEKENYGIQLDFKKIQNRGNAYNISTVQQLTEVKVMHNKSVSKIIQSPFPGGT